MFIIIAWHNLSSRSEKMRAKERNDLLISWVTISIAFAFMLGPGLLNVVDFATFLPISFVGVGTAFVFHELAHRQVARKFGCHAEFRAWTYGLIIALVLPIITFGRFLFAAPGAVYIYGPNLTRKQNGIISLAGPATNIIVGIAFLSAFIYSLAFLHLTPYILEMLATVARINLFLALFNLIPFPPLDGSKVIMWDVKIWALVFFPLLLFFGFLFTA